MSLRARLTALLLLSLPLAATAAPFAWTVNSDDQDDADQLLSVDLANGDATFIGPLPSFLRDVEGLALDNAGELYAVDNSSKSLVIVDKETGQAEAVSGRQANLGFLPTQVLDFGMSFTCDGRLLMVAEQTESLYEVDLGTGQARVIGESGGLGDSMTALAAYGRELYGLAAGSGTIYRINPETGDSTTITTLNGYEVTDAGLAFDEDGVLWAVLDGSGIDDQGNSVYEPSPILQIDVLSGSFSEIASSRPGLESLAIVGPGSCDRVPTGMPISSAVEVPVMGGPAALLLGLSLALLGGRRLRKRERGA